MFTNEELANIAALSSITVETIQKVNGVGQKKADRFGKRLCKYYANSTDTSKQSSKVADET